MGSVIVFANQKGGVAKTTTVHSLGDAFLERGRSVLLVDLDPQACLTYAVGIDADVLDGTLHDVVVGRANAVDVLIERDGCPAILPSSIDLAGAEVHLLTKTGREYVLARALQPLINAFDYVLLDCSPSLGSTYDQRPDRGSLRRHTVSVRDLEQSRGRSAPRDRGRRSQLHQREPEDTGRHRDDVRRPHPTRPRGARGRRCVLQPRGTRSADSKSIRVAEAPGHGLSVLRHAPTSPAAVAYRDLAASIEAHT